MEVVVVYLANLAAWGGGATAVCGLSYLAIGRGATTSTEGDRGVLTRWVARFRGPLRCTTAWAAGACGAGIAALVALELSGVRTV